MTAKRFTLAYADYDWWAICDKENPTKLGISDEDVVELLNGLYEEKEQLKQQLKSIEDSFKFSCTENYTEFNKDKLIVKDTHTKIHLDNRNLFIEVYIPQIDEFYRFKYTITGKSLMREFIGDENLKGDKE